MKRVLVTGSSGNVGREVMAALKALGLEARGTHSRNKLDDCTPSSSVRLDFYDRETWEPALNGVHALFLLRPPPISDVEPTLNAFFDVARQAGVEHTVFLSVMGAGKNKFVPHHKVEQHLIKSEASITLLRPGFFAQNLADAYRRDIVEDDRIFVPAGHGRAAFVDLRDVAQVAALAFQNPKEFRGAFSLTGPRAFSFQRAVELLSEELHRPIRYEAANVLSYGRHLRRRGMPLAQIAVQTILHVGLRFGQAEEVDGTLERLLGRVPFDLESYIHDHVALWRRDDSA